MEIKKTPEADLEKERIIFFLMGFTVALSLLFISLEWQSTGTENYDWKTLGPVLIESEFTGVNQTENNIQGKSQANSGSEIVFEDYKITNDPIVVEIPVHSSTTHSFSELNETPLLQTKNEPISHFSKEMNENPAISEETMPQFPGGQTALIRFIYENIQYPVVALKQRIEGRVWCSFIVESDGSISDIQLEERVYFFLDEEALRVLKMMPSWIPGKVNGENIRVKIYIPIVFKS